jgi:hypothetical protein
VQLNIKLNPCLGNGGLVWPSTFILAEHIRTAIDAPLCGSYIAELGAGTGLLGIWAATQGAHVVLTDLAELLPLLMENVSLNMDQILKGGGSVRVLPLIWGDKTGIPAAVLDCSLIVGSDLVHWIAFTLFDDDTRSLLCQTMCELLRESSTKRVYLCHEVRTEQREAQFVHMINEVGLRVQQESTVSYSPWSDVGADAHHSGFLFNGVGKCASDYSKINGDGLVSITAHSSRDLREEREERDVVILQVSSAHELCPSSTEVMHYPK